MTKQDLRPEFKIIADHLRSSCFLIADGVMPSNEGRGYVLRRIMRRAMRQIHKLGAKEATMHKLVDALIKEMGVAFPELVRARATIIETLKNEEEKFRETLEKALKTPELEETILQTNNNKKFSGKVAFKLYDTHGLPLDVLQDILKEKNIEVDVEGFNREMEIQRKRAKENWAGSGETVEEKIFFDLKEKFGETKFLGYETLSAKAKVLAVIEGGIILDQTPFYATSGGQKGDDGFVTPSHDGVYSQKLGLEIDPVMRRGDKTSNDNNQKFIEISETKKFAGGLFVHFFNEQKNFFKVGDEVVAEVNQETRQMRAANHSSTHLLHKALKEIIGDSISQKGSNVDAENFTFDFNFNRAMTAEEIEKTENLVNNYIRQNSPVKTNLMSLEKARETGAEALFGEKYDSEVRVVEMGKSVELCGGTHVEFTGNIGIFKIISEKGIAAGIRRIEAKSGSAVIEFNRQKQKEAENSLENLQQELKKKDKEIERLKKQILFSNLGNLSAEKIGEISLLQHVFEDVEAKDIREITSEIKARKEFLNSHIFAFFGVKDDKVSVCLAVSSDLLEKFDAIKLIAPIVEAIGGKGGGGKKDLAMGGGSNEKAIPQAIEILKKLIK
jgi:alanyl-tRNA synthetase